MPRTSGAAPDESPERAPMPGLSAAHSPVSSGRDKDRDTGRDSDSDSGRDGGRDDESRFRIYTGVVVLLGIVATIGVAAWLPFEYSVSVWWIGPLLALSFLLAEQLGLNVDVRSGISWTISFTEIPLVIGFFVAPFEVVLLAHLAAGVGTLLVRR